ncbi:HTTM domain-containing protein [Dyadobacter tibetensis]|uniref:HTTM domain-containing protein n=1 Tax=Dyadobacter tibetensis TaxID=1211851 RepID=UPI00047143B4|nr:HTTM domain-containing protein [Dyadobacter tibetensis]
MQQNIYWPRLAYLQKSASTAPLAVFRILFGLLIGVSMIRFALHGWIDMLYIQPLFHFSFYGFSFIKPLGQATYLIFGLCLLSSLMVTLGWYYRWAALSLFLSFTYIELMDQATYLNHYYFISLMALLMTVLPAGRYFSVDVFRKPEKACSRMPAWCLHAPLLLVFILYFYAGLAKLNSDWLLHALPLKIWLPARNDMPLIGQAFNLPWIPYLFSWFGCFYDLTIVFFLLYKKTRVGAYLTVVVFHGLTAILFPIGMFPYIMMVTALLFFPASFHHQLLDKLSKALSLSPARLHTDHSYRFPLHHQKWILTLVGTFFIFQLLFPFRYGLYPNELFWSEEGYRFSWRVMLMEKAGQVQFTVQDSHHAPERVINSAFLTPLQEKMMATQPDLILQFAHYLRDFYTKKGFTAPKVYADTYVSLNGRLGQTLIDPSTDLARETDSFQPKSWILPFKDEIKGL